MQKKVGCFFNINTKRDIVTCKFNFLSFCFFIFFFKGYKMSLIQWFLIFGVKFPLSSYGIYSHRPFNLIWRQQQQKRENLKSSSSLQFHMVSKEMVRLRMIFSKYLPVFVVDFMVILMLVISYGIGRPKQGPFYLKAIVGRVLRAVKIPHRIAKDCTVTL